MLPGSFAARAYRFYTGLEEPRVPAGVHVMNPYADRRVRGYLRAFLKKYYEDGRERVLVIGINPGRFGAGVTGITFSDPVALADYCGIETHLPRRRELSSVFVYDLIERLGGVRRFFAKFFLTAASPLGFTHQGTNLNYYDTPHLLRAVQPYIVKTLRQQLAVGARRDVAFVLGRGANYKILDRLNSEHGFFERLEPLDHPRFIMQYRRRKLEEYLNAHARMLSSA